MFVYFVQKEYFVPTFVRLGASKELSVTLPRRFPTGPAPAESGFLENDMKNITTAEARKNLSDLLNRTAYGGERFVVTRHGKGLVAIVPLEDSTLLDRLRSLLEARDFESALQEIADAGTVPWDEVRRELGL